MEYHENLYGRMYIPSTGLGNVFFHGVSGISWDTRMEYEPIHYGIHDGIYRTQFTIDMTNNLRVQSLGRFSNGVSHITLW